MIVNRNYFEEFELDLTGTCNLSCPLCTRNYSHGQHLVYKNVRPLGEIIEQLDTFTNLKRAFVAGQVSEPTLYPEFLDYLRYLKSRNIYIELFSNGSTRDEDFWKEVGNILDDNDQMHFTVCGSTQELHEIYRVGSSLDKILKNANAYRSSGKTNDYCQFIKFEYNAHDEENTKNLGFTNWYSIPTEGIRRENDKVREPLPGVKPEEIRDRLIKSLYKSRPKPGDKVEMKCKSLTDKKIYIDQQGKIAACYVHYEYEPHDIFSGDEFDYSNILDFKFQDCWACTKKCRTLIEKMGVDFIC